MSVDAPLVAHVIHRFDVGGMENGLVNLINRMPAEKYRHAVVSLTDSTSFRDRVRRDDVAYYSLHKKAGHDWGLYLRLYRLMKELTPAIVHTRNLAAVEAVVPAAAAGVPRRIHGEHGRDLQDVDGTKRKYRALRRVLAPLVHRFIALSEDLESYLVDAVGVSPTKISRIINGVDTERFRPAAGEREPLPAEAPSYASDEFVIGTVTRMQAVKDPLNLVLAFERLVREGLAPRARLVMIGDGPLAGAVREQIDRAGLGERVWLAGARDDVPELYRSFDAFALSSRVEGISNTVLEAMACGLPVIASRVGGNAELVVDGETGALVPSRSPEALAEALAAYANRPEIAREHGRAGRRRAEECFDISGMVSRYTAVYDEVLAGKTSGAGATVCVG